MGRRSLGTVIIAGLTLGAVWGFAQTRRGGGGNRWAQFEIEMQNPADDPPDAWEEREWAFGRLRYRSFRGGWGRSRWGIDANKSDRVFVQGLQRLTRVQARSVEEILDVDSDEMFNWPWMYAVGPGDWVISPEQGARLRQYFERGGFLMVDDFHNDREFASFMAGIDRMIPGAAAVELEDDDPIFHIVYDIKERVQIPGLNVVHGRGYERGGIVPHWRGIRDNKGRVVVAICHNMDLGDAWEWADLPEYPEKYATQAFQLGINYVIYSMTH